MMERELEAEVHKILFGDLLGWAVAARYPGDGYRIRSRNEPKSFWESIEPVYVSKCICDRCSFSERLFGHCLECLEPIPHYCNWGAMPILLKALASREIYTTINSVESEIWIDTMVRNKANPEIMISLAMENAESIDKIPEALCRLILTLKDEL